MKRFKNRDQINYSQKKSKTLQNTKETFKESTINEKNQSYDIKNATYEEFSAICNRLYRSNRISLYERGMLTFNPTKSLKYSDTTKDKPNNDYYITKTDLSGKRDWLLEFEKRIENQRNLGNILGADHMDKTLSKIKKLLV